MINMIFRCILSLSALMTSLLIFSSIIVQASPLKLYVSTNGRDSWTGTKPAPAGNDGPFATPEAARDAIRTLIQQKKHPKGGVQVLIRGGIYERTKPLQLGMEDSGTASAPILWEAYPHESVIFLGGKPVNDFHPVTDPEVLTRLPEAARGKVLEADLKAQGIDDYGEITAQGFGRNTEPLGMELFFNNKPMQLARWPLKGWLQVVSMPNGPDGDSFTYNSDEPEKWKPQQDLWTYGYWQWDWADSYVKVKSLDAQKMLVQTSPPYGIFGYHAGRRFYFLNVLDELGAPGEWYLDRDSGILYFWPPAPLTKSNTIVSIMNAPFLYLKNTSWITLKGITMECARGNGALIQGGTHNLLKNCVLQNLGDCGLQIDGGDHNGADHCVIAHTGEGGVQLNGGDRQTLTPGNNFVNSCEIYDFSRWVRTYKPAVSLNGVGNRVSHCSMHDAPHAAILFGGNDHTIEYNDIYRVCTDTSDAGAIYTGRDWTMRGTVIRYNYIHDLMKRSSGEGFNEVMGVYLDDTACGTTVYGNIFNRISEAILVGGGRDNIIENNIFVNSGDQSIVVDARGLGWAKASCAPGGDWHMYSKFKEIHFDQPPYSTHYPALATILKGNPAAPAGDEILRNICVGAKWLYLQDGLTDKTVEVKNNFVGADPGFVNAARDDYRLKKSSPVWALGFKPIPVQKIGIEK